MKTLKSFGRAAFSAIVWWRVTFVAAFVLLNFCSFLAQEVANGILTVRISRLSLSITKNPP